MPIKPTDEQLHHLLTRNVSEIIQPEELESILNNGKTLKIYLGVDPSSPDIHLGHAVVLRKLREFQDLGHKIILLIGDFTAQIGDPTGKTKGREPLTHDAVLQNARDYKDQAAKILLFDGENKAEVKFNSQWLDKLTFKEVIELAGQFSVQQMLERDMFQERLKNGQSIGLHEFLYPLMVGYDCVVMDVDVEVGGNDQLFNIKAGRILMEKMTGKRKVVLTCDLLTGSDGSKMSKSAGNVIPLSAPAAQMFGQLMSIKDDLIVDYARLCSDMIDDELTKLNERLKAGENPRDVKMDVAERIVALYAGSDEAIRAKEKFTTTFGPKNQNVGVATVDKFFPAPMPQMKLVDLVAGVATMSKSEARRLILGKAVELDRAVETDPNKIISLETARVGRIGKHTFIRIQYLPNQPTAKQ